MTDTKLREKAAALIAFTQLGPRFIAWVEAVTDAIAPEPEKVAKVETMADRIAADLKAGTFRGEQPAPPEPTAPVNGSTPVGEYDPDMKPAAREMTTIRPYTAKDVRAWIAARGYLSAEQYNDFGRVLPTSNMGACMEALAEALEEIERNLAQPVASFDNVPVYIIKALEAASGTHCHIPLSDAWQQDIRDWLAVRQQAAQGRKVELGKARKMLEYMRRCAWHEETYQQIEEALAELDAAEGKGEGRG